MAYRMSSSYHLHQRELGGNRIQADVRKLCFSSQVYESNLDDEYSDDCGKERLPLSLAFSQTSSSACNLAVGFEDGSIAIYNTQSVLHKGHPGSRWRGHKNVIFDIVWNKMDSNILTASGDQAVTCWDVRRQQVVASCKGHNNSVKTISVQPFAEDCFASGGRDGSVKFWDIRTLGTSARSCKPCAELKDAHVQASKQPLRRRRDSVQGISNNSVTSVLYLKDGNLLASAGAANGVVKFWDLRALRKVPVVTSTQLATSDSESHVQEKSYGITSLSQDDRGRHLAASCTNGSIYLLNPLNPEGIEISQFKGHDVGSFYVKAKLSPDGNSIVSGSSDSGVYVWQVSHPEASPTVLHDHFSEVTAVDWCPSDLYKIATCSDDTTVRVWTPNHFKEQNETQPWLTLHGNKNRNRKKRTCNYGATHDLTFEREKAKSLEELKAGELSNSQIASGKGDGMPNQEMEEKVGETEMTMLLVDANKTMLSSSNLCEKRVRAFRVEDNKEERRKRGRRSEEKTRTIRDYFCFPS